VSTGPLTSHSNGYDIKSEVDYSVVMDLRFTSSTAIKTTQYAFLAIRKARYGALGSRTYNGKLSSLLDSMFLEI